MSSREKIKKGLISTLGKVQADMAFSYLHSQGVVIKGRLLIFEGDLVGYEVEPLIEREDGK